MFVIKSGKQNKKDLPNSPIPLYIFSAIYIIEQDGNHEKYYNFNRYYAVDNSGNSSHIHIYNANNDRNP